MSEDGLGVSLAPWRTHLLGVLGGSLVELFSILIVDFSCQRTKFGIEDEDQLTEVVVQVDVTCFETHRWKLRGRRLGWARPRAVESS